MRKIVFILFTLTLVNICCSYSKVSVEISLNDEVVEQCKNAAITDLSPKDGGYRFHCDDKSTIYVIYATGKNAIKGSVTSILIDHFKTKPEKSKYSSLYAAKNESKECAATRGLKLKDSKGLFSKTLFGNLQHGSYPVVLSKPCGRAVIKIND